MARNDYNNLINNIMEGYYASDYHDLYDYLRNYGYEAYYDDCYAKLMRDFDGRY